MDKVAQIVAESVLMFHSDALNLASLSTSRTPPPHTHTLLTHLLKPTRASAYFVIRCTFCSSMHLNLKRRFHLGSHPITSPIHRSPRTPSMKRGKLPEIEMKGDDFSGGIIDLVENNLREGEARKKEGEGNKQKGASCDEKKGYLRTSREKNSSRVWLCGVLTSLGWNY